jgi:hypothetical protein
MWVGRQTDSLIQFQSKREFHGDLMSPEKKLRPSCETSDILVLFQPILDFLQDFQKSANIKFQENPPTRGSADNANGRTDIGHAEGNRRFS